MSHLTQLKRQISSIKTTEKITHAMRLIAMSLYSKLNKQHPSLTKYVQQLQTLFSNLVEQCPKWQHKAIEEGSPFLPNDFLDSNPLFIVISATKGFCGGLNNNLFRYIEYKLHVEEHQTPTFITIGKKATAFVSEKNPGSILVSYYDLNSNNYPDIARNITKLIMHNNEKAAYYSSVTIFSSIFKNFFIQKPTKTNVIPIHKESDSSSENSKANQIPDTKIKEIIEPIWEQNSIEIVNAVAHKYLSAQLTSILFEALISEYASRFIAMDNATTNAEKYLESLTLQFNKLRQALITSEVSELSASL